MTLCAAIAKFASALGDSCWRLKSIGRQGEVTPRISRTLKCLRRAESLRKQPQTSKRKSGDNVTINVTSPPRCTTRQESR
ncbi:hypothetical protein BN2476_750031 [Paraburkholderia piptadeniae]|uniref:Uncharacterized protein n=1 Tax=Paraburkholderia piptadeniae TaxID=1701573 RepID=A0A1N7SRQ7_9BURK|nr:hypothetical protein BN2476_750031 [Paraburkholderia piptadeniae]